MKLLIRDYFQQIEEAPSKIDLLGLEKTESESQEKCKHIFLMLDRVSNKHFLFGVWSRECFIKVYIDNWCKVIINNIIDILKLSQQQVTLPSYEEALRDSGHGSVAVPVSATANPGSSSGRHGTLYESGLTVAAQVSMLNHSFLCHRWWLK